MSSLFMIFFFHFVQVQGLTFQNILQALSPDNTYGVDSGGDPNEIPKLTFEEFKVCYQFGSKFWILTYWYLLCHLFVYTLYQQCSAS